MDVFISYRREDTQDFAGRLADRLRMVSGIGAVFVDVDGVRAGEDFHKRTHDAMAQCGVCLVVLGRAWRGERTGQQPRIFDEEDLVRGEIRAALTSTCRVIPVLVNDAVMPGIKDIPGDLQRLVTLNAVFVRHVAFDRDLDHLADAILQRGKMGRTLAFLDRRPSLANPLRAVLGAGVALFLLVVTMAVINARTSNSLADLIAGPDNDNGNGAAILIVVMVAILGAALAFLPRALRKHR